MLKKRGLPHFFKRKTIYSPQAGLLNTFCNDSIRYCTFTHSMERVRMSRCNFLFLFYPPSQSQKGISFFCAPKLKDPRPFDCRLVSRLSFSSHSLEYSWRFSLLGWMDESSSSCLPPSQLARKSSSSRAGVSWRLDCARWWMDCEGEEYQHRQVTLLLFSCHTSTTRYTR